METLGLFDWLVVVVGLVVVVRMVVVEGMAVVAWLRNRGTVIFLPTPTKTEERKDSTSTSRQHTQSKEDPRLFSELSGDELVDLARLVANDWSFLVTGFGSIFPAGI